MPKDPNPSSPSLTQPKAKPTSSLLPSTRRASTRTRTLLFLAAAPLVLASLSAFFRYSSSNPFTSSIPSLVQQRPFSSLPNPPPTSPVKMPFPKGGAEKSRKAQAQVNENYGGRTYTQKEEKEFGRLGSRMEDFHGYFRQAFNETYSLADGSFAKKGYSLPAFLTFADDLYKHLEGHHGIEERFMFPILSKRMTASFGETHPESHRLIHAGLEAYHSLLVSWKSDPSSYSPKDLRANMDTWREVLFRHLDEEVKDLGTENMLKFWTIEEVRRLPI